MLTNRSINHSEITVVFASETHMPTVLKLAGEKCPKLRMIVSVDALEPRTRLALDAWGKEKGVKIVELSERECSAPPQGHMIADYTSRGAGQKKPIGATQGRP